MKDIEISRDKKNPTWAWVGDSQVDVEAKIDKRIVVSICENGVVCVINGDNKNFQNNKVFATMQWFYYEIIKEPTYRPIETLEDYIEATKNRQDLRVIAKDETYLLNLGMGQVNKENKKISFRGYDGKYIFENCVWLDDRSPVGVKCL